MLELSVNIYVRNYNGLFMKMVKEEISSQN
jgi:hypothetical protein